ncbi:hypothetical protein M1293_01280 [Candidatus Parvarchaeota archaeon]|nr:hypothetical protein [Candidatus Parvarchaeota archaeon]
METQNDNSNIQKESSGVEGLDEALRGGLPKGSVILITGSAGSGKTLISMQFLAYGARNGENGIYFTLEESAKSIIEQFSVFDKDVEKLIADGKLKIVEIPLVDYESLRETILSEIEASDAKRIVIDSITYFQMFFSDVISIRKAIIEVASSLKIKGASGILIGEIPFGENKLSTFGVEEFAVDGVIALYLLGKGNSFVRALRIIKMRNSNHITKFIPMEITSKGVVTYPSSEVFADI